MRNEHDIKVSIIEDTYDLNKALELMISTQPGFQCLSSHVTAEEAIETILVNPPDIVLVDLGLPGMSGQECISLLKEAIPKLDFLVLTIKDQDEQLFSALKAGANGYLLKSASLSEILDAIKELYDGGAPMSAAIARKVVSHFNQNTLDDSPFAHLLTSREREVLECLSKGMLYKEIAAGLYVSIETVKSHCHNIYEKLHVSTRTEALNKYYAR